MRKPFTSDEIKKAVDVVCDINSRGKAYVGLRYSPLSYEAEAVTVLFYHSGGITCMDAFRYANGNEFYEGFESYDEFLNAVRKEGIGNEAAKED